MNATNLLHQVLDFVCFWQNDINKFEPNILEGQEPSYYRLQQLESLFKAFELTTDHASQTNMRHFEINNGQLKPAAFFSTQSNLENFIHGRFIDRRADASVYQEQINTITSKVREILPDYAYEKRDYHPKIMMTILFSKLFRFRKDIHPFTQKDRSLQLDYAFGNVYARYLTEELAIAIAEKNKRY